MLRKFFNLVAIVLALLMPVQVSRAQNVEYLPPERKEKAIELMEILKGLLHEGLRNYRLNELEPYLAVPAEYETFIAENVAVLDRNITLLRNLRDVPVAPLRRFSLEQCNKGFWLNPHAIMGSIATARANDHPIYLAVPPENGCARMPPAMGEMQVYSEGQALALLTQAFETRHRQLKGVRIGSVSVDASERDQREAELRYAVDFARQDVVRTQATVTSRLRELETARIFRDDRVAVLREPVDALRAERDALVRAGRADPAQIRAQAQHDRFVSQIKAADRRSAQIDAAIRNLFENYPASDTFARDRIRALQAEQEQVVGQSEAAQAGLDGLSLPRHSAAELARIRDLSDRLYVEDNDARRRIALEQSRYDSAVTLLRQAENERRAAEARLAQAMADLRAFKLVRVALFERMQTEHAEFTDDGALPDMSGLNRKISRLSHELFQLTQRQDQQRAEMLRAVDHADNTSRLLSEAGGKSIAAQVAVELGFSLYDLYQAQKKGKTAGLAAEAWTQLLLNMLFWPTSYADANKGTLADFMSLRDDPEEMKYLQYDEHLQGEKPTQWGKTTGIQIAKHLLSQPKEILNTYLEKKGAEAVFEQEGPLAHRIAMKTIEKDVAETGMSDIGRRMAPYFEMLAHQEELAEGLAKALGKRGKAAMLKGQVKGFAEGALKEVTKEIGKQALAEWIEQPAFDDYMNAQVDMAIAVGRWREAGIKRAQKATELATERGTRDTLLAAWDGYDPQTGWTQRKNDLWMIAPGYAFWLDLTDAGREVISDIEIALELQGVALERIPRSTQFGWRLPDDALDRFGDDLPDRLHLVIKVK